MELIEANRPGVCHNQSTFNHFFVDDNHRHPLETQSASRSLVKFDRNLNVKIFHSHKFSRKLKFGDIWFVTEKTHTVCFFQWKINSLFADGFMIKIKQPIMISLITKPINYFKLSIDLYMGERFLLKTQKCSIFKYLICT